MFLWFVFLLFVFFIQRAFIFFSWGRFTKCNLNAKCSRGGDRTTISSNNRINTRGNSINYGTRSNVGFGYLTRLEECDDELIQEMKKQENERQKGGEIINVRKGANWSEEMLHVRAVKMRNRFVTRQITIASSPPLTETWGSHLPQVATKYLAQRAFQSYSKESDIEAAMVLKNDADRIKSLVRIEQAKDDMFECAALTENLTMLIGVESTLSYYVLGMIGLESSRAFKIWNATEMIDIIDHFVSIIKKESKALKLTTGAPLGPHLLNLACREPPYVPSRCNIIISKDAIKFLDEMKQLLIEKQFAAPNVSKSNAKMKKQKNKNSKDEINDDSDSDSDV